MKPQSVIPVSKEGFGIQGWIRVEDKIPEIGDPCLIYCDEGIAFSWRDDSVSGVSEWKGYEGWLYENVTHWMPLPNPPGKNNE